MKIYHTFFSLIFALLITACSTSSDVSSNQVNQEKYSAENNAEEEEVAKTQFHKHKIVECNESNNEVYTLSDDGFNSNALNPVQKNSEQTMSERNVLKRGDFFSESIPKKVYFKQLRKLKKKIKKEESSDDDMKILLYILCFFLPPIAVGLATDWDLGKVLVNILFCLLCGIPGIIHALIVVKNHA